MKEYPSIPNSSRAPKQSCYAFIKYDGSNIRGFYSKKNGWCRFGSRKLLIDRATPVLGVSIDLFLEKYSDDLTNVFKKEKIFRGIDEVLVFFEFFGAQSFAGQHVHGDPKNVVLFDVNPIRKGMLGPKEFLDLFGHLEVAEHIYTGNLNEELIRDVRESNFNNIDFRSRYWSRQDPPEGIICKGGKGHDLWMAKIKSQAYFDKLKSNFSEGWEKYGE